MTTPPSTGNGQAPDWLPDEATLSRMAGEFFAAIPGTPSGAAPDGLPGNLPGNGLPSNGDRPAPDVPPPAPTAGVSPHGSLPSGTAPASYATTAAGLTYTPELPVLPELPAGLDPSELAAVAAAVSAGKATGLPSGVATGVPGGVPAGAPAANSTAAPDTGAFYFLSGKQTELPSAPALPGFGHLGLPKLPAIAPVSDSGPFYFLDVERPAVPQLPLDPHPAFDVNAVRRDFPILSELVNGRPLIWLDNAATTQKPQAVLDRLVRFYSHENSNIHRAAHELAARATDAYEQARDTVARFIGAGSAEEIVFVRGTTEAINLVAKAWGPANIGAGDEIVISHLEHHANIVPWQMLVEQTGAVLKVIPVDDDGQVLLGEYTKLLSSRTKLVAVTQVSNALGTVVPVEQIIELGHRAGATVLIDAAQSVPHMPIDVSALGADFLVFSGHKIFGPTGIGVLYGRKEVLADMPPWEGGGNMIADVTLERSVFQPPPGRFEAGTGNIADAVGLGAALDYVQRIGLPNIAAYEHSLVEHATECLREIPGLRLVGTAAEKASVVSFVLDGYEPVEVGTALNEDGIAVRSGHHCAQPILRRFGLEATVRPSFAFYNTHDEVDSLVTAVRRLSARKGNR
ncbi:family 2A encapsulin nanocompartment cargo protein cysteine desulfurase [Streptomyces sp. SID13031]|uniref:family 2A encapsulin nanocompartment cargo protein cysteine desulfurase n=1 Tax=Streptomyces sp. SID13031 TaxID=2706046 RepID=UPI001EF231AB|nr:family 2A encapsulin nanocompartment cargo protein cysteine desulfurase [Streptomyces sp. SID13031]